MLRIVGDEHCGNMLRSAGRFEYTKDVDPVAVIDIEFSVDQVQVNGLFFEDIEGIGGLVCTEDFDVEMFSQERRDRRMIRSAVADIEDFFACHNELTIHWVDLTGWT